MHTAVKFTKPFPGFFFIYFAVSWKPNFWIRRSSFVAHLAAEAANGGFESAAASQGLAGFTV